MLAKRNAGRFGIALALSASVLAAVGLLTGTIEQHIAVGIAVIGIVVGSGLRFRARQA